MSRAVGAGTGGVARLNALLAARSDRFERFAIGRGTAVAADAARLAQRVRRDPPAIVQLNPSLRTRSPARETAFRAAIGDRVPAVFFTHGWAPEWLQGARGRAVAALLSTGTVLTTAPQLSSALGALGVRSHRVATAWDPTEISGERRSDGQTMLFLGSLTRQKGVDTLLDAFARLGRGRLRLAGTGPLASTRAPPGAEFVGWVTGPDKAALLAEADIVVLPSRAEGCPLAVIEAMGAGCAVVATPVGAIPEVLGATAPLVPIGDVEALASTLGDLLDDPARCASIGAANAARATRYTVDALVDHLGAVYADLIGAE